MIYPTAEKKGLGLRLDLSDEVTTVTSDQRRLEQVVLNLLSNALKFTEKGEIRVSCHLENNSYVLSVADTGVGIEPDKAEEIFLSFHQIDTGLARKHEGTGLGLSISKKLIEKMGGTIQVESHLGRGSTFTLRFAKEMGGPP